MYNPYLQKGMNPYAMYQPQPEYDMYQPQPEYDMYQPQPPKHYIKLFMGCALVLINLIAFLSITAFCGKYFPLRSMSVKYYGWFTAFTSICLTIGIIGLILNIIPFTKPIVMFIFPFTTSIMSILVGAFTTTYVAMTLDALKKSGPDEKNPDKKCNTHTSSAMQVMGISVLVGGVYAYYGYYPPSD